MTFCRIEILCRNIMPFGRGLERGPNGRQTSGRPMMNEHSRRLRSAAGLAASLIIAGAVAAKAEPVPELDCVIEPQQLVKLSTPVVGVIGRIDVDRGDVVTKGQELGKLEDGLEQANLKLARAKASNESGIKAVEARLDFLHKKYDRVSGLAAKSVGYGSQQASEEAASDVNVAEAQLKEAELTLQIARLEVGQAEETLKQRTLVSPIDGVVTERLLVPGEYRNEQSPILTLAQIDPLRVEVFVPTSQYGRIKIGSNAEIHPQQPIGGSYAATVTVVDQVLDAASGTFGVRLALPNPDLRLPAGIRCKVLFETQEPTSMLETTPPR
jgi:RND family efflux transporter MFP subunit